MAQGRSTEIITMSKWIRTSRLSIKNSLSAPFTDHGRLCDENKFVSHADAEARRSVLTALACATLVTLLVADHGRLCDENGAVRQDAFVMAMRGIL